MPYPKHPPPVSPDPGSIIVGDNVYCVVHVGYQRVLLRTDDALAAFRVLSRGMLVEYDYNSKGFKPSAGDTVKLETAPAAQLAVLVMHMNEAANRAAKE